MSADPWNAFITRVDPGRAASRAALRSDPRRQGSLRHRGRSHDLRVGHLRRARPHANGGGSAAAARRRGGARRQDQSRRVRLGRARGQPVARHVPKSDPARADDRRLLERLGCCPRRRSLRPRARHGHRRVGSPAVRGVRCRRAEVAVGAHPDRRCLSALPHARHRRTDGAERRGRRDDVVAARGAAGARAPTGGSHHRTPAPASWHR